MSHFVYFLPSWTGLISIQLFSVHHVHIQCLILINEWTNLEFCTSFAIRQQWLPPNLTNCMVFNFNNSIHDWLTKDYRSLGMMIWGALTLKTFWYLDNTTIYTISWTMPSTCMHYNSSKFRWSIMWPLPLCSRCVIYKASGTWMQLSFTEYYPYLIDFADCYNCWRRN